MRVAHSAGQFARWLWTSRAAAYALVLVCWLAVDVIVAVSNDGVWVLNHAYAPRASGLVEIGYRYLGYPLFARSMIETSGVVGIDPLFAIVVGQRLLVLVVGFVLARQYRMWGAILFGVGFSVPVLIQIDYILAESLAVVLCAALAILFGTFWFRSERRTGLVVAMAMCVFLLAIMRRQFLVFLAIPGVALIDLWLPNLKQRSRQGAPWLATGVMVLLVAVLGVFQLLVDAENERDLGDVDQAAEAFASVEYLSAWRTVFLLEGIAPSTPYLEEVYAEGSPWPSWRQVRTDYERPDWPDRFTEATDTLLAESGLNLTTLRVKSFLGGLVGGRYDDMSAIKQRVESDLLSVRLSASYGSGNVQRMGEQEFLDRYNEGLVPGALVTSTLFGFVPVLSRYSLGVGWLVVMLGALVLLQGRRSYTYLAVAAMPHVFVTAVGAWFLGDTYRWLLPTLMFSFIAAGIGIGEAHRVGQTRTLHPLRRWAAARN